MADLGTITYYDVSWTAGDIITEAKLDAMVANDQAYDSHKDQGLLLGNNKALAGKTTGGDNYNLIKLNSSNLLEIGDSNITELLFNTPLIKPYLKGTYHSITSNSYSSSVSFNLSKSNIHTLTLSGNCSLSVSNASVGQSFIIILKQDSTGSRTVTWWSGISWTDGVTPNLTTTANKYDIFGFICIASGTYLGFTIGQNL